MYSSIVVGTDGSSTSHVAVEHAIGLACDTGATLHLVHAYRLPSATPIVAPELTGVLAMSDADVSAAASDLVAGATSEARQRGVGAVRAHVVAGPVAEALCTVAEAEGADLIVVGNKGMHGARRVLGSVPNRVAHRAACAVLIVPTC